MRGSPVSCPLIRRMAYAPLTCDRGDSPAYSLSANLRVLAVHGHLYQQCLESFKLSTCSVVPARSSTRATTTARETTRHTPRQTDSLTPRRERATVVHIHTCPPPPSCHLPSPPLSPSSKLLASSTLPPLQFTLHCNCLGQNFYQRPLHPSSIQTPPPSAPALRRSTSPESIGS
jgi:hypothetical protein